MNETTEREREWVVSEFADLIEERGAKTFLGAPLLVAAPRWFPDAWTPDVSGARAMLARVLGYAGLGALPFQLRTEADPTRTLNTASHRGAAAWFEGSAAGGLQFGVETSGLNDPEGLVGVFAHEVGHAFRAQHDLVVTSRDEEERLTDLTTVFLGFGVLTTNNAMRQRAVGTSLEIKSWGYLGARTLGYALAVQLAVLIRICNMPFNEIRNRRHIKGRSI